MKNFKSLLVIIAVFIVVFTVAMAVHAEGEPIIDLIKPDVPKYILINSGKLEIIGTDLLVEGKQDNAKVDIRILSNWKIIKEIIFKYDDVESWDKDKIILTLPKIKKEEADDGDVEIRLTVNNGDKASKEKKIWVLPDSIVIDAILLKSKMSEEAISDYLYHKGSQERERNGDKENVFGNAKLTSREVYALKEATFDDNFIAKMTGQKQHVNIGVSAIWLDNIKRVVAAPMIRIFLSPKSFYQPREDLFKITYRSDNKTIAWAKNDNGPDGFWYRNTIGTLDALWQRTDLNVGYTTSTSVDSKTTKNVDKSYYLVGVSFEINPSALVNVGYAFLSGKDENNDVNKQWYLGFTLDENILRKSKILQ